MDWLTPTRRAVRWSPMVVAGALAAATLVIMRVADRPLRADVFVVALAMVVLGAVCGLHDPAREFVHAMPVSAARRLTQRLVVLVPVVVVGSAGDRMAGDDAVHRRAAGTRLAGARPRSERSVSRHARR